MEANSSGGKHNLGYQSEETALQIMKSDAKIEEEQRSIEDGHVTLMTDGTLSNSTSVPALRQNKNSYLTNGDIYDTDEEFVLQKKEFDLENCNRWNRLLISVQTSIIRAYEEHKIWIWRMVGICLLLAFFAYFAYAMYYRFGDEGSIRLLVCTICGSLLLILHFLSSYTTPVTDKINDFLSNAKYERVRRIIRWGLYIISTIITVTVIIVVVALDKPENLISLAGLAAFILLCFVTSYNPAMIDWHPIFWGFSLQFYFALAILRSRWGYDTFKWLGDRITEFLAYSNAGASFVFGDVVTIHPVNAPSFDISGAYNLHFFVFTIMPVITFFSTIIAVLYYLGVMQAIIKVIGHFLSFCLGTTPAESLNAAGNIFVAMTESPLLIRPFLPKMTSSELHAVMVGGFATIAGGVLGVYIGFGVPADHLLSASVMSAPAALAISKLTYPEIEVPIVHSEDYGNIEKVTEGNLIEAACSGAVTSGKIIASAVVNIIAFLSLLKFLNATLSWFGERVGVESLSFEFICSYLLYPVALFMGTEPADCRKIAELVGIKTFTNEFIAYQKLSVLLKNRKIYDSYVGLYGDSFTHMEGDDLVLDLMNGTKLQSGIISKRSAIIATYALCGFSNFGSMGILLGSLTTLAPKRKSTISKLIFRAMIAGNVACFFTACVAGLFFQEF